MSVIERVGGLNESLALAVDICLDEYTFTSEIVCGFRKHNLGGETGSCTTQSHCYVSSKVKFPFTQPGLCACVNGQSKVRRSTSCRGECISDHASI